jgi:hypothetical protein
MSKVEVNQISSQCGSTLTIGQSGDTVTLACGATQTGFGRTGTVDWDTTAKTASFTAVSGTGYFVNTTSGAVTMTLPASPSAGDIVAFKDYAGTFATNNLTIGRNGSNLDGNAADKTIDTNNTSMSLVYVDATQGWKSVEEGTGYIGESFITACGGTETTCGDYKIHTFTSPGTFTVSSISSTPANNTVDYLVVAGGGGGGSSTTAGNGGGGGGGGGFRSSNDTCMPAPLTSPLANPTGITVTATSFPITVGGGGAGNPGENPGSKGSDSVFSTITSTGGGQGSGNQDSPTSPGTGGSGGSGGGGHQACRPGPGNTPPVSPPQGNNGGGGNSPSADGGGGAGAAGTGAGSPGPIDAGQGGIGSFMVSAGFAGCNGDTGPVTDAKYFAGGGGGGNSPSRSPAGLPGTGGAGGGGDQNNAGATNTGGGGGGNAGGSGTGYAGGSGIVIIRYKYQ